MSRENVELVRSLQPTPDVDLVVFFQRDGEPEGVQAVLAFLDSVMTEDFVCIFHAVSAEPRTGAAGLRDSWLDWLAPWSTYRAEIDELIDVGDRVLLMSRDYARRPGLEAEVELQGSAVYTVRDGKLSRAEYYAQRDGAFAAVGLEPR